MPDQSNPSPLPSQHQVGPRDCAQAADSGRYVIGYWSHIFADDSPSTDVRIVFDNLSQRLVAMQIHTLRGYVDAGRAQLAEVQGSLLTASAHVIDSPVAEGFELAATMPDWSAPARKSIVLAQFEHDIALCKGQHGQLIDALVFELGAAEDAVAEEFRWDVIDNTKGNLATAAVNAETDDRADQEGAIDRAEAWVADHVSAGALADVVAASIVLTGADNTQAVVLQLLAQPVASPGGF